MNSNHLAKALLPPLLLDTFRRWSGQTLRFSGQPRDWAEASRCSTGYATATIVERVAQATRAVVSGKAAYERDSVLFQQPSYPFPILSVLFRSAALNGGRLAVLDFGGSLGSTYRQCRPLLQGLAQIRWRVVEQPSFVAVGRREFTTDELSFADSLNGLPADGERQVILLSSVLQYLETPASTLQELSRVPASHLVFDRTPLSESATDRLCIQHVPRKIYAASYPCWILSHTLLHRRLEADWTPLCNFPCAEGHCSTDDGVRFEFRGLVFEKKR